MSMLKLTVSAVAGVAIVGATLAAQAPAIPAPPPQAAATAVTLANRYQVTPDVTYLTASNGFEVKLDVYRRRDVQTPQPTLVFYHGGGWVARLEGRGAHVLHAVDRHGLERRQRRLPAAARRRRAGRGRGRAVRAPLHHRRRPGQAVQHRQSRASSSPASRQAATWL